MMMITSADYVTEVEPESMDALAARWRARTVLASLRFQQKDLQAQLNTELSSKRPNSQRVNILNEILYNITDSLRIHNR